MPNHDFSNVPFYYEFRTDFVVLNKDNELHFVKYPNKRFINQSPIKAREEALQHYQNFIDGVLISIGKSYISDRQARVDLIDHFRTASEKIITMDGVEMSIKDKPLSFEIGVYFTYNYPPKPETNDDGYSGSGKRNLVGTLPRQILFDDSDDEGSSCFTSPLSVFSGITGSFIHGIKYFNGKDIEPLILGGNLWEEYEEYVRYKYKRDVEKFKTTIYVYSNSLEDTEEYDILETEYDWAGLDEPHSSFNALVFKADEKDSEEPKQATKEQKQEIEEELEFPNILDMINLGESKTREFKPALIYNYTKDRRGSGLYCAIPICAFLNTAGGILFIGVNDDKTIQGLNDDFSLVDKIDKKDGLLLEFSKVVNRFFRSFVQKYIRADFVEIDSKTILVITIEPAEKPVFMKIKNNDEIKKVFYLRGFANNQELFDLDDIFEYISVQWFNK